MSFKHLTLLPQRISKPLLLPAQLLTLGLLLTGCNWDDKYQAINCDGASQPGVNDCRTERSQIDSVNTQDLKRDINKLSTLQLAGSTSWAPAHVDEQVLALTAHEAELFVSSKFHNHVRRFVTDNAGQVVKTADSHHLAVAGARYQIDGATGASEQLLGNIKVVSAQNQLAVISETEKYSNSSRNIGIGLYLHPLDNSSTLPAPAYGQSQAGNFLNYNNIDAFSVNPGVDTVAVTGKDRVLSLHTINLNSGQINNQPIVTRKLNMRGKALAFSSNDQQLYFGGITIVGQLAAFDWNADNKSLQEAWRVTLQDTPQKILAIGNDSLIAKLASGNQLIWIKANGEGATSIELAAQASDIAYSAAHQLLAVSDVEGGVEVIHLASGKRAYRDMGEPGSCISVSWDNLGTLWLLGKNSLHGLTVPAGFIASQ